MKTGLRLILVSAANAIAAFLVRSAGGGEIAAMIIVMTLFISFAAVPFVSMLVRERGSCDVVTTTSKAIVIILPLVGLAAIAIGAVIALPVQFGPNTALGMSIMMAGVGTMLATIFLRLKR